MSEEIILRGNDPYEIMSNLLKIQIEYLQNENKTLADKMIANDLRIREREKLLFFTQGEQLNRLACKAAPKQEA